MTAFISLFDIAAIFELCVHFHNLEFKQESVVTATPEEPIIRISQESSSLRDNGCRALYKKAKLLL